MHCFPFSPIGINPSKTITKLFYDRDGQWAHMGLFIMYHDYCKIPFNRFSGQMGVYNM